MNESTNALSTNLPNDTRLTVSTMLSDWSVAMERCLVNEQPMEVVALAHIVVKYLPRHLATYQRILRATWLLRRWEEGEEWGKRLLRADPGNPLAWRSLAMAAEERGQRVQAHATWQRAFEADPYEPEIRAGLSRTSLRRTTDQPRSNLNQEPLMLNLACLATLYLRSGHWDRAAATYHTLLQADARRVDFQVGLMVALWQQRSQQAAYRQASQLVQSHPYLLMGWVALAALGDENDKALARNPIETLDPDGDFVSSWFGTHFEGQMITLDVLADEADLLKTTMFYL